MSEHLAQADRYLLEQIRQGSSTGWAQLVERYEGRLAAFARRKIGAGGDAEDMVQDTFVSFLKGLPQFREEASLETYLFLILRRKIAGWVRGRRSVCSLQETLGRSDDEAGWSAVEPASPEPTASWYVRRDEEHEAQRRALTAALREVLDEFKLGQRFCELQIVEMIFYGQLRNSDAARLAGVRDNYVAVTKHRLLERLQGAVASHLRRAGSIPSASAAFDLPDTLLTQIWQEERLSCPKRSTIGAYVLGTLEAEWNAYVAFHLEKIGCQFCHANLDDMRSSIQHAPSTQMRDRILQSTVGFFGDSAGR